MLSLSHGLTGAFIATKIPNPFVAIPLILASHYIEDWILHWDVGTGLSNGSRKKRDAILLELVDMALTIIAVIALFQVGKTGIQWSAYWGMFVGLLPDFVEAPRNFFKYNPWWLKPFNDFHGAFHHSTPNMLLGLAPQFVVIGLIVVFH
ncbi:hypothetical protein C5B42_03065 [Candidatus Cerribacteria bacterium 'Amazon FNV 2010 28 9']|uniref:DUF3307 domain-containing protein n=1 Tax=Candidatus Cerribacteria bacterium 'Amazon FNV 2010 28 9' TaxID=2081795 RepID=A0A317JST0_9BACT|nr:MAG: hypothetical protein C5B42_03065 [Candidatus Cerribacteria bacterium 'Amazon FNV 2010 28 9']